MLKVLLIDDEVRATDVLRLMIERMIPEIGQVLVCNDARNAAAMIHEHKPSLVFLDVQMPHMNGFEVLKHLPNKQFKVIFTTAYNEYAIQAIRFSAFDYLLKPVDIEELIAAIKRFRESGEDYGQQQELLQNIMHNMEAPGTRPFRLALPTREGVHYLIPAEIVRLEALGNYTRFFTSNGKQYLISKTLGDYEELLSGHGFIRTHKSHLVNPGFISFIDHDGFVVLKDSSKVEVSRRRKDEVMGLLRIE